MAAYSLRGATYRHKAKEEGFKGFFFQSKM
jgi:hypothetical protein